MPPRRLSEREREEWLRFAQAMGTKPLRPAELPAAEAIALPGAAPANELAGAEAGPPAFLPPAKRPMSRTRITEIEVGKAAAGLDGASWNRLRRGQMRPERVLDLHGRTAQGAFSAFDHFIASARADGIRCVEIVTGRGAGEGGVLRRELPLWLNLPHLRGTILAAVHPHRANVGAVVLLLRRIR
jgi:DNA-nicking Smr family endonuclease